MRETLLKVLEASFERENSKLDPTDMGALQRMIEKKRKLQALEKLHISL